MTILGSLIYFDLPNARGASRRCCRSLLAFSFLDLAVGETQNTRERPAHGRDVVSEQCKPYRQHPNAEHRKKSQDAAPGQRDPGRQTYPHRIRSAKSAKILARPIREVTLEAVHFLVEIWFLVVVRHHRHLITLAGISSQEHLPETHGNSMHKGVEPRVQWKYTALHPYETIFASGAPFQATRRSKLSRGIFSPPSRPRACHRADCQARTRIRFRQR
jgi:hypothetical protein